MHNFPVPQVKTTLFCNSTKFPTLKFSTPEKHPKSLIQKTQNFTDRQRKNLQYLIKENSSTCASQQKENLYKVTMNCDLPLINIKNTMNTYVQNLIHKNIKENQEMKIEYNQNTIKTNKKKVEGFSLPRMPKKMVGSEINQYKKFVEKFLKRNSSKLNQIQYQNKKEQSVQKKRLGPKCKVVRVKYFDQKKHDEIEEFDNYWHKILISEISVHEDESDTDLVKDFDW